MTSASYPSHRFPPVDEISSRLSGNIVEFKEPEEEEKPETGRVKTRFLNFKAPSNPITKALARPASRPARNAETLGWLNVVDGPGNGTQIPLTRPMVQIGRDDDQDVQLAFGDNSISREGHASITYYGRQVGFLIRDGLKPNPIHVNGKMLRGEDSLIDGDLIRIGETTLQFAEA
ncbi:FHA domain-containing protein [Ovoidimarina sediminis]|uniref:FHA domain-containing protein n=1 Tax=Ovoidimarina sediminis TaxID=3079856 RepID=UPI002906C71B|nr:FHA domain-containing protein [Rhodophyticola sp. MJ-SS7]MDU8941931.1 FHA domain-containing protein [Rhodophyticola sp. MJ-SS7]